MANEIFYKKRMLLGIPINPGLSFTIYNSEW